MFGLTVSVVNVDVCVYIYTHTKQSTLTAAGFQVYAVWLVFVMI